MSFKGAKKHDFDNVLKKDLLQNTSIRNGLTIYIKM